MRLSRKSIYALRVLPHLAEASSDKPISITRLAAAEDVPIKYLEQIFAALRKSGLLVSEMGVRGGYRVLSLRPARFVKGLVSALFLPWAIDSHCSPCPKKRPRDVIPSTAGAPR